MISALLAAAAVAASTPAAAPKPAAPAAPVAADATPRITAQTPLTVTFTAGFLEQLKAALHSKYTGDEADPAIELINKQEKAAVEAYEAEAAKTPRSTPPQK